MAGLCAVLPLKISGWRDARNLAHAQNLLRTLDHFWTGRRPFELTIACRPDECAQIAASLRSTPRIAVTVIDERAILTQSHRYPGMHGWYRQMAIKLGFSRLASQPFYLVLDADILCCRPFDETTFFREDRAITEWEVIRGHPDMWVNTAAALRLPLRPVEQVLAMTPNIFSAETGQACLVALRRAGGEPWDVQMARTSTYPRRQFSEFAIYTRVGLETGLLDRLHWGTDVPKDWPRLHAPIHIWVKPAWDFDLYKPADWIRSNPTGHFTLVESTLGYDPAAIMAKFEPLLSDPATPASTGARP